MSLDLTLNVGEKVFNFRRFLPTGSERIEAGSSLAAPDLLLVRHQADTDRKTGVVTDRHTITNSVTVIDSNGLPVTITVNLGIVETRSPAITAAIAQKAVAAVVGMVLGDDFAMTGLTAANQEGIDKLSDIRQGMS